MLIYKIFRAAEWAKLEADGASDGAPIDVTDGYVHFSTAQQVAETAQKYFSDIPDLKLCACDTDRMGADLKWEASRGGALFPHLYRQIRLSDVVWARDLPFDGQVHVFPEDME